MVHSYPTHPTEEEEREEESWKMRTTDQDSKGEEERRCGEEEGEDSRLGVTVNFFPF